MAGLTWTVDASHDLDAIGEYIGRLSPGYAPIFVSSIIHAAESLTTLPRRGRVVPELGAPLVRELLFQNYRIVYSLRSPDAVTILGVVHSAIEFGAEADSRGWRLT